MAKLENDTNQVQSPIDIAMQMVAGTQDIIFNAILGPQQAQRVDKIAGEPADPTIDAALQRAYLHGQEMNLTNPNNVTAPARPAPTPTPMPSPPQPPNMPGASGAQPQQEISNIMNMLGGGMNGSVS